VAADRGRRVLLVSMDPAHSLGDALDTPLTRSARRVGSARFLEAVELDADRALARWLSPRRPTLGTIAERGTYLDREDVGRFLGLSLPGVDELIGLLELARLASAHPYDEVVVDTAPTGHTLRLLDMPATLRRIAGVLDDMQSKHRFLAESRGGRYRIDDADRLVDEIDTHGQALAGMLRDPTRCTFTWVLLAERLALEEARDGVRRLDDAGIPVREIVVNRVAGADSRCPRCRARADAERAVLDEVFATFADRVVRVLPTEEEEPRGIVPLRRLGRRLVAAPRTRHARRRRRARAPDIAAVVPAGPPARWLDVLAPPGSRLCLVGGKGGVGKTTCAAALALALATRDRDRRVLLLSTDPAHSLGDVLGARLGDQESRVTGAPPNFAARELDADRTFALHRDRYRDAVDRAFTKVLSRGGVDATFDRTVARELLELAPPGLDELFGMLAVVDALFRTTAPWDSVVVDTAPTGHTLRLLGMPATALEWVKALLATVLKYRAVIGLGDFAADLVEVSRDLRRLDALLRDPVRTRFIAVTRPAELPRRETARLVAAVGRLGITTPAVIANAVSDTGPHADARDGRRVTCRRCARRNRLAVRELARVPATRARARLVVAPIATPPPIGVTALEAWSASWRVAPARRRIHSP
jgi:arsenite-transporting ATPase